MTFRINGVRRVRCKSWPLPSCGLVECWDDLTTLGPNGRAGRVTWWEVAGKSGRALGQMPGSLMILPSCSLHYLDKGCHSQSSVTSSRARGVKPACLCFFHPKPYCTFPTTVPRSMYKLGGHRLGENRCYPCYEESIGGASEQQQ